jgi:hypothetical protein
MASQPGFRKLFKSDGRLTKNLFLLIIIAILISILWTIYSRTNIFPKDDFIEYWASGRINLTGGNPYDPIQMHAIEQSAGWTKNEALMMLNPPWTLLYAMFLGIFSYPVSRFLCFIIQLITICICTTLLWQIYTGEKRNEWISWLAALTFAPVLHALKSGQATVLILLGSVGFLYYQNKKSDFWAGISASLIMIKPQLLYILIIAILFWSITRRRYNILFGLFVGLIMSLTISMLFNPHIITQYLVMMKSYPIEIWMTSTLGTYLRLFLGPEKFYLQFIPLVIGLTWFLAYWYKNHGSFEWMANFPLLILVSIATTPYAWTLDSIVSLCCIIHITALFDFTHWTVKKGLIFSTYWLVNLSVAFLRVSQSWFWWYPVFLLIWYLLSYKHLSLQKQVRNNLPAPVST